MMGVQAGQAGGEGRQASATNGTLNPVLADPRAILDEAMIGNTKQEHIETLRLSPTIQWRLPAGHLNFLNFSQVTLNECRRS